MVARGAEAFVDLVDPGRRADEQAEDRDAERREPAERRAERADDLAVDLLVVPDRREADRRRRDVRALAAVVADAAATVAIVAPPYARGRRAPAAGWLTFFK